MTTPQPTSAQPPTTARTRLLAQHTAVPTSALGRLWQTGRSAVGVGAALVRSRRGEEIEPQDVEQIVARLGGLKGVAMKVGQMLGYVDPSLPPELRRMMSLLQTAAPSASADEIEAVVREALGERADALLAGLEREPFAVASIGQVHRGRLPDGTEVAVKIRHRGIEEAMRADFRSATLGKAFAAVSGAEMIGECIDEAKTAFLEECDFRIEAQRQAEFAELFADDAVIVVPEVFREWSSESVLVTRWTAGASLTDFLASAPSQRERDVAGEALFRFWMRTLYRDGLFHGDPHPGNFAFLEGGRIVVYDFGCVRSFDAAMRRGFARLAAAARADDAAAMMTAIEALGGTAPRDAEGRAHVRALLLAFFGPLANAGTRRIAADEGAQARSMMADKRAIARLRLPGRMLFLFRLRFGLYSVLAQLGAEVDWSTLEGEWAGAVA